MAEKYGNIRFYHIYRDIRTYGKNETLYEDASKRGVTFIKYSEDNPPKVFADKEGILVKVEDLLTPIEEEIEIPVDMVVLVTGMISRAENEQLYRSLKISAGKDGFLLEVHPKLRPVETSIGGVFIAGTCQAPKDIRETLVSAQAAASKAATITLKKQLELEPFVAYVNPEKCSLSQLCIGECDYGAIEIKDYAGLGKRAWVNEAKCKGCGACIAVCPTEAIQLKGLSNSQVKSMIEAMAKEVET
jgi:heterodisulfide reductase subunit A